MKLKLPNLIVGVCLLFILINTGLSQTTNSITITNYSFENPVVADGSYETASLPNWSSSISGSASMR